MRRDWSRRRFLKTSLATLAGLAGTGRLPLRASSPGAARNLVLLWMDGGPSQIDTFDPKPGHPNGGDFRSIPTAIPGVSFTEHLPGLASRADRLAIVRSLSSREGDHDRARTYVQTGRPLVGEASPGVGSVLSRIHEGAAGAYAILDAAAPPGFLGTGNAPLLLADPTNPLQAWFPEGLDRDRLRRRFELRSRFASLNGSPTTSAARTLPPDAILDVLATCTPPGGERERYGDSSFGEACRLAVDLVGAGARFVQVTLEGWDSHINNFGIHQRLMSVLDPAFSALLDGLDSRGLLDDTVVLCMGEFGRTPVINRSRGRDHHPAAFSAVMAGGALRTGRVVGATSESGESIAERPVSVPDLLATVYAGLGVDPQTVLHTPGGRPVPIVDGGSPIAELI